MGKLLCKLGWHAWYCWKIDRRICVCCEKKQKLVFYSNRTQEWVGIDG